MKVSYFIVCKVINYLENYQKKSEIYCFVIFLHILPYKIAIVTIVPTVTIYSSESADFSQQGAFDYIIWWTLWSCDAVNMPTAT